MGIIVTGYIAPMRAEDCLLVPTTAARGESRPVFDLQAVKDLVRRRCGTAAEHAVGRSLLSNVDRGRNADACAQAMREILDLAEGVMSESPSPTAVAAARRITSPSSLFGSSGRDGQMDLITLSYAVLYFDERRTLNGGLTT